MDNKIAYDEILIRMGFFRQKAKLSQRETSLRLGFAENYIKRLESKKYELKVSTLLNFFDVVGINEKDFFYLGRNYSENDKNILEMFSSLSAESKTTIIDLMKKLK